MVGTRVEFDAKQLRKDMAPASGGHFSRAKSLAKNVTATRTKAPGCQRLLLRGSAGRLGDAPGESTELDQMVNFVSQVAPLAYPDNFPFKAQGDSRPYRQLADLDSRSRQVRHRGLRQRNDFSDWQDCPIQLPDLGP